jgi:glycosyltransferase involved in cell wall biosynthesis
MLKDSSNITFVFNNGRKNRLNSEELFAKEHFYSYFKFLEKYKRTQIIEYETEEDSYKVISKILRKITKFPIYIGKIITSSNKKILDNSDYIFFSNQNLFYSSYIYLFLNKNKKRKNIVFFMGYKNILKDKKKFNTVQSFFFKSFLKQIDHILFISKNELKIFLSEYPSMNEKAVYVRFGIDNNFWINKNSNFSNSKVLFVGNDENRDYKSLINIVNGMPDYEFLIISNKLSKDDFRYNNYSLINSDWKSGKLTDLELKGLMEEVKISIIPITENTTQPSGQSVALQCFAMGIPVIMSNFRGIWYDELMKNNINILYVDNNNTLSWSKNIDLLNSDNSLYNKLASNGKKLVDQNFNIDNFFKDIEAILKNS